MDVGKILAEVDQGTWYDLPNTNVKLRIKRLRPVEIRAARKKSIQWNFDSRRSTRELDEDMLNEALLDMCIVDWKNIEKDGQPLPCTFDNKKLLNDNWSDFADFWLGVFNLEQNIQKETEQAEEKN